MSDNDRTGLPLRKNMRFSLPIGVGILVAFSGLARALALLLSPERDLIGSIPDDAFYYSELARHFAQGEGWTFDGHEKTTGFHLLHALLLSGIFLVDPRLDWTELFTLLAVVNSAFFGLAAFFLTRGVVVHHGNAFRCAVAGSLPYVGGLATGLATNMMESGLVALAGAASIYLALVSPRCKVGVVWPCVVGFLGSLARSDFGLLPAAFFGASALFGAVRSVKKTTMLLLVGSVGGLLTVLLTMFLSSGRFGQGSSTVKFFWSSLAGHDPIPALKMALRPLAPAGLSNAWVFLAAIILILAFGLVRSPIRWRPRNLYDWPGIGSLACILGYVAVYALNSQALLPWYQVTFLAPLGLFLASVARLVTDRARVFLEAFVCVHAGVGVLALRDVPFEHQQEMLDAGRRLADMTDVERVGSWNAGILGAFSGGKVVNLDGLTNDGVIPYLKRRRLFEYLTSHDIEFVADYDLMLSEERFQLRGGFVAEEVVRCLEEVMVLAPTGKRPGWRGSRIRLYRVREACSS